MSMDLKFKPDLTSFFSRWYSGSSGCWDAILTQSTLMSPIAVTTELRSVIASDCLAMDASRCLAAADASGVDEDVEGALEASKEIEPTTIVNDSGEVGEVVAVGWDGLKMLLTSNSSSFGLESASATKFAFPWT